MAEKSMTTAERGYFKENINLALFKSDEIKELLLGDTTGMSKAQIQKEFKKHVFSHLFIDDTIEEEDSFIFYDVVLPTLHSNIKQCTIYMYLICHRNILDNYHIEGYHGNRADILSQMVENVLLNDEEVVNDFGIGKLRLDSIDVYNSRRFYGCIMRFDVPNFRWCV